MTWLRAATDGEEMRVRRLAVTSQARAAAEAKTASEAAMQVAGIVYLGTCDRFTFAVPNMCGSERY